MELRGKLKNWNDQKGFGFIVPEQGGPDVFAHISAMRGDCRPAAGDQVLYVDGRDAIRRRPQLQQTRPTALRAEKQLPAQRTQLSSSGSIRQLRVKLLIFLGLCALPLFGSLQVLLNQHALLPLLAYVLASVLAFLLYWYDKQSAQKGRWRTQENTLHLCELAGGWPGALLAQQVFRHKTRKTSYQLLFWGIVLLHQVFWIDYLYMGRIFSSTLLQRIIG